MAEKYTQLRAAWETHPTPLAVDLPRQQVRDLEHLDALNAAQTDPYLKRDPAAQELDHQMRAGKLAMRLAAAMFGVVILYFIWATVRGLGFIGCSSILAVIAIIQLIFGRSNARSGALILALLTAGGNILINLIGSNPSPIDVIVWCAFGLSMTLMLVGRPNYLRIGLGGAIFAVGVVGLYAFLVIGGLYFPTTINALLPKPTNPFGDDFSKDRGCRVS